MPFVYTTMSKHAVCVLDAHFYKSAANARRPSLCPPVPH